MTQTKSPPMASLAPEELERVQRRTLGILMVGVLPSGAGMAAAYSTSAILGKGMTGSDSLGTLAAASMSIGGALASVPLAAYMSTHGRRAGLQAGWGLACAGTVMAFVAALTSFYPLLPLGMIGVGIGNATNLSARFAAADLATDETRGRSIGTLSWAKTFGSALGPTIGLGAAGTFAVRAGLPGPSGAFIFAMATFVFASIAMAVLLRPDPLELAGGIKAADTSGRSTLSKTWTHFGTAIATVGLINANTKARFAVYAMVVGQGVMAGIMTATPLHMTAGAQKLTVVGFVISVHIVGMYFFSPIVGYLSDRIHPRIVIGLGGLVSALGAVMVAFTPAEERNGVLVGLFFVGLGWSFSMVSGSALLTSAFPVSERTQVQGSADLLMTGAGATASLSAGVIYQFASYRVLGLVGAAIAMTLTLYAAGRAATT